LTPKRALQDLVRSSEAKQEHKGGTSKETSLDHTSLSFTRTMLHLRWAQSAHINWHRVAEKMSQSPQTMGRGCKQTEKG
jgi:hypothetical protein